MGLSISSLVSAIGMSIGYGEKSLMSALARKENGGFKSDQMIQNAKSDGRCAIEWFVMTTYLFFTQLKPIKFLFDLGLPINALHDGLSHLFEPWLERGHKHSHGNCNGHVHEAGSHKHDEVPESKFKQFLGKLFSHDHEIRVPKIYFNKLFFGSDGNGGLRAILFKPLFKLFGCQPPDCYINNEGNLVARINTTKENNAVNSTISKPSQKPLPSDTKKTVAVALT